MVDLHPKKKIEIVVEAAVVPRLTALIEREGATGYTVLPAVIGHGSGGDFAPSGLSAALSAQMVLVVAEAGLADRIVAAADRLLADYARMILVSDVGVVRGGDY